MTLCANMPERWGLVTAAERAGFRLAHELPPTARRAFLPEQHWCVDSVTRGWCFFRFTLLEVAYKVRVGERAQRRRVSMRVCVYVCVCVCVCRAWKPASADTERADPQTYVAPLKARRKYLGGSLGALLSPETPKLKAFVVTVRACV